MRRATFEVPLRGQPVCVIAQVSPPDRDVGIMGPQIEEVELFDALGEPLDWELTDEELYKLYEALPEDDL